MSPDNNSKIVGIPQASAACVGAIIIYVSQSGSVGKDLSQILIYTAPVVSAVTGGAFSWLEDCVREAMLTRRIKAKYKRVIDDGNELLKVEDLDADARSAIFAAMNQARLAYMNRNLHEFHSDLKPIQKSPAPANAMLNKPRRKQTKTDGE